MEEMLPPKLTKNPLSLANTQMKRNSCFPTSYGRNQAEFYLCLRILSYVFTDSIHVIFQRNQTTSSFYMNAFLILWLCCVDLLP